MADGHCEGCLYRPIDLDLDLSASLCGLLFVTTVSGSRLLHRIEELLDEIYILKVSLPHSLKMSKKVSAPYGASNPLLTTP